MLYYKGIKIADEGFVINLKSRTDRKQRITEILDSMGFTGYKFEEGVIFGEEEWRRYGCTQTYINIFEKSLKNNYESIIVFEDDAKQMTSINTEQIDKIFENWESNIKNYDLIALGTRPLHGAKIYQDSEYFGTLTNALCTQSHYYTKDFMLYTVEALGSFKEPSSSHHRVLIDEFINDCCSHEMIYKTKNKIHRVGITIPMIFTQYESYSDIEKQTVNYDLFIEGCFWDAIGAGKKIKENNI